MSGTQRDPGIAKQRETKRKKKAAENAAGLSVAEKLTRASKEETVEVLIPYSEGDFSIKMRLALVSEQQAVRRLTKNTGNDIVEIEKELAALFAEHSIDKTLDYDFWMCADISPTIFQRILYTIIGLSEAQVQEQIQKAKEIIEAQSFRED